MLGCGTCFELCFEDECGLGFRMILKALHKYMLIGLLFVTLVMNFICTLNYVLGTSRDKISQGFLNYLWKGRRLLCILFLVLGGRKD